MEVTYTSKTPALSGKEHEVVQKYISGSSKKGLSAEFNVSEQAILTVLTKNKVSLRTKKEARNSKTYNEQFSKSRTKIQDQTTIAAIVEYYNAGNSAESTGDKFGISHGTVRNILADNNIQTRTSKESSFYAIETRKQSNLQKYGVEHPMHLPEIFAKQKINSFKYKSFIVGAKKFNNLQGYEHFGIDYLIKNKSINASQIIAGIPELIPRIPYIGCDNKQHIYYPDIYLPHINTLVEIKSKYTYTTTKNITLIKQAAAKAAGYIHIILVFNENEELIEEITMTP